MPDNTAVQPTQSQPLGLAARFVGIVTSPRETFAAVARHPKWFGVLAIVTVVGALLVTGFMLTPVGQQAYIDKAQQGSMFGPPNEQQMQAIERMAGVMAYFAGVGVLVTTPLFTLLIAGVGFLIFGVFTGGDAKFKQVFAVVAHSNVIGLLGQLVVMPLNYVKESLDSPLNLSVFFPMLPDGSFLMKVLGSIDLFRVWWVMALSIGFAVVYRRKTSSVAALLFVIYAVLAIGFAAFSAARS
jgi:hypothetical protein